MPYENFPAKTDSVPRIYAYSDTNPEYAGMLKVGYTSKSVQERVAAQYPTARPGKKPYKILLDEAAMRSDGTAFTDHEIHRELRRRGIANPERTEWFECNVEKVRSAIIAVRSGCQDNEDRSLTFKMRPEQVEAVEKTAAFFRKVQKEEPDRTPHFLWNAKMRFGKTFAAYQLAKKMKWRRVLVLTFKPAVQSAWESDLKKHVDFKGWQFVARDGLKPKDLDESKPFVCFGSFQDYLGKTKVGGIKRKNEWAHTFNWDCIILDEYHFGAWRERAKELYDGEDDKKEKANAIGLDYDLSDEDLEDFIPLTTNSYLYLSGTPFRALGTGEFIEDQIFNWTYSDEQKAKEEWRKKDNPYQSLPRMVLLTYQLPEEIKEVALAGEFDEFDLNVFFKAEGEYEFARFVYEAEVQKWLNLIRGAFAPKIVDSLKQGSLKPPMPFSDVRLLNALSHTLWFMPNVASCYAMRNLLAERANSFYHDYNVVVAAGTKAGTGLAALPPVYDVMRNPLESKTITVTCGKLTTGVTVKPWTGILMLRNLKTPESYFQSAFRVQSPWTLPNPDGTSPNEEEIIKKECYIFDFAPDRALRQIQEYSCELNTDGKSPEKKVEEFIKFLPVLCYDGSSMREVDAKGILDFAMSGTTATLLARKWESALLVNVDNSTLQRVMDSKDAMDALMRIEGFRSLNQEIETIINRSNAVKQAKAESADRDLSKAEKKQLTEAEKEQKSLRKQIQDKLIKFATRVPVFVYLTDYREETLKDVITKLEPGLFKRVTGLSVKDFELLVSLGVFNGALMNDAVYKFKRYEDASLRYAGIDTHTGEDVGLFDTTIGADEYPSPAFENMG